MIFIVAYGNKNHVISDYKVKKDSKRGSIIDRNGVILAGDVKTKSLYVKNILVKNILCFILIYTL